MFSRARLLLDREQYRGVATEILRKEGLNDPTLLIRLESLYLEHKKMLKDRETLDQEAKRQARLNK